MPGRVFPVWERGWHFVFHVFLVSIKIKKGKTRKLCLMNEFANETEMTRCHTCRIGTVATSQGSAAWRAHGVRVLQGQSSEGETPCDGGRGSVQRAPSVEAGRFRGATLSLWSCESLDGGQRSSVRGFYQSSEGQAACLPCVPGKYQDEKNGSSCKLCPVNEFANETEMTRCRTCSVGTVATSQGSAACSACAAGEFGELTEAGGPACSKCQAGRFRRGDSESLVSCETCPAGFYQSSEGQAACLPCVPGKYQDEKNGSSCKLCPVNEFANETEMTRCRTCSVGTVQRASCSVGEHGMLQVSGRAIPEGLRWFYQSLRVRLRVAAGASIRTRRTAAHCAQ